jgi:hypothetical protein
METAMATQNVGMSGNQNIDALLSGVRWTGTSMTYVTTSLAIRTVPANRWALQRTDRASKTVETKFSADLIHMSDDKHS